jgi:UDP-N-acetylglucosamine 2-epimerase (non-hydrolysing)
VTLRENTERPETVDVGANMLVGTGSQRIMDGARKMHGREKAWKNPFGDGTAGQRIIQILVD